MLGERIAHYQVLEKIVQGGLVALLMTHPLSGHGSVAAEHPRTHSFTVPAEVDLDHSHLQLTVLDDESGEPTAARFTLQVDGSDYVPEETGSNGIRLLSIHTRKRQYYPVTYARGTGPVYIPLPEDAARVTVQVAKGFEYVPARKSARLKKGRAEVTVRLRRWINLEKEGWQATDEHVHFDRLDAGRDQDWLTMMEGDGLGALHVMTLEGANLPDVWARQFAYGRDGEAFDGTRFIRPGEEFRNADQGHYNLLGISRLIEPISTGRMLGGEDRHWPPSSVVLNNARELGGIGGVAHGGAFGARHTAVLDTVLGNMDFFEIFNPGRYKTDLWYRMLNAGYLLSPAGGTDLPNSPQRAWWQPFLGSVRCYVQVGVSRNFESWKKSFREGRVFVTTGPVIRLSVDGREPGGTLRLAKGREVEIEAELLSLHRPKRLMILFNGKIIESSQRISRSGSALSIRLRRRLRIEESGWLAAQGAAAPAEPIDEFTGRQPMVLEAEGAEPGLLAHTGVVRVLVGEQPIGRSGELEALIGDLADLKTYYEVQARYPSPKERLQTLDLFEEAMGRLRRRLERKEEE